MRGDRCPFAGADVRQVLRLSHALHEAPPDPVSRKRVMLEGLCRLLRADAGMSLVSREEVAQRKSAVRRTVTVATVRHGISEEDAGVISACYRSDGDSSRQGARRSGTRRGPGGYAVIESVLDVRGMKVRACLALLRRHAGARPFAERDRAALDLLHSELAWVYGPELPPLSPAGVPLSPRQRQTLQLLLAGNSEKQIGRELGLSTNTVHHHVKAIHRHFGVSSRSELLARWVRN